VASLLAAAQPAAWLNEAPAMAKITAHIAVAIISAMRREATLP